MKNLYINKQNPRASMAAILIFLMSASLFAQGGNSYQVTQSTTTNGGGESMGSSFKIEGSIGESAAETDMQDVWDFEPFTPQTQFKNLIREDTSALADLPKSGQGKKCFITIRGN